MTQARTLLAAWKIRDQRYAMRRHNGISAALSTIEKHVILATRRTEVELVPADDRAALLRYLDDWTAPLGYWPSD